MRGEYSHCNLVLYSLWELPPRARRIPHSHAVAMGTNGTTSACAENTCLASRQWRPRWNYLRVRGEYKPGVFLYAPIMELPPRARRILRNLYLPINDDGTTSACAENTVIPVVNDFIIGNYLRVRGEYPTHTKKLKIVPELPPRARRIQAAEKNLESVRGTTSAYAENTTAVTILPF